MTVDVYTYATQVHVYTLTPHRFTHICMCAEQRMALFIPETSILLQNRHPYTGNLNSETFGDSQNTFL